jgi:hypothetical protein
VAGGNGVRRGKQIAPSPGPAFASYLRICHSAVRPAVVRSVLVAQGQKTRRMTITVVLAATKLETAGILMLSLTRIVDVTGKVLYLPPSYKSIVFDFF